MNAAAPTPADASPRIEATWRQVTPRLRDELVAFWSSHGAVDDPARAAMRAAQAVCVARDASGRILAVATAVVKVLPRLRQPMYYYRHFFDPSVRGQRFTKPFMNEARRILDAANRALPKPESLGVLVELQSDLLARAYTTPYVADVDYTFIGYSPRGAPLYVSYFKDAVLAPPVVVSTPRRPS